MALSVNETSRLNQWFYALIVADPVIVAAVGRHDKLGVYQVYDKIAPEGATFPYITFQFMPEADKRGGFGARLFSQGAFLVKAVNSGTDAEPLWQIADAFDNDLQDNYAMSTPTGLIVMGCTRDLIHDQSTIDDGVQYNEVGGRYMVQFYLPGQSNPGGDNEPSLPPTQTVQEQIDALKAQLGDLEMSFQNAPRYTGRFPIVPISATGAITKPTQNTTYQINSASPVLITLYPSTGDNTEIEFVNLGAGVVTFAYPSSPAQTGATLANIALSVHDATAFKEAGTNDWEGAGG